MTLSTKSAGGDLTPALVQAVETDGFLKTMHVGPSCAQWGLLGDRWITEEHGRRSPDQSRKARATVFASARGSRSVLANAALVST